MGNEVLKLLKILLDKTREHTSIDPDFETTSARIHNSLIIGYEFLSYYYSIWNCEDKYPDSQSIEGKKQENAERVLWVQKMILLESISAIEFTFKNHYNEVLKSLKVHNNKRIYLGFILEEFKKSRIISTSELSDWKTIIDLRNCIVHNNAISDKSVTCRYLNFILEFKEGQMIQGDLKLFLHTISWLIDSSRQLIQKIIKPESIQELSKHIMLNGGLYQRVSTR